MIMKVEAVLCRARPGRHLVASRRHFDTPWVVGEGRRGGRERGIHGRQREREEGEGRGAQGRRRGGVPGETRKGEGAIARGEREGVHGREKGRGRSEAGGRASGERAEGGAKEKGITVRERLAQRRLYE